MRKQTLFSAVLAVAMAVPFFSSCNKAADIINNLIELTSQITVVEPDMPGLTYPETYQVTLINESTGESKTATTELKNGKKVASVKIMGTATGLFSVSVRGVVFDEANNKLKDFWANASHVVVVAGIVACDPSISCTGYNVKHFSNANYNLWMMTQSLRYVPVGKSISENPADGNGVWYPYTSDGTACTPDKSDVAVAERGLLYDHEVAFGAAITAENFKSFEGTRGICPLGWHIPTQTELMHLVGYSLTTDDAPAATDDKAIFYDAVYAGARMKTMNEAGFNLDFAGSMMRNANTATGKYQATITKDATCSVSDWMGKNAVTYYMGSTGHTVKDLTINRQFMSLMTAFTTAYKEGKMHVAYSNYLAGNSLRCVKDAASE